MVQVPILAKPIGMRYFRELIAMGYFKLSR
jgi:hypothetical protein